MTAAATSWHARAALVLIGTAVLWTSAKAQVPFWPVPMTLQTYVVLILGPLLGWRLGAATMVAYLGEGAVGLPVFAGTPMNGTGLAYVAGPTGGYLAGYLAAVILVGALVEGSERSIFATVGAMLAGELTILGLGCSWLALYFGWRDAITLGFGPFVVGDALKLLLAAATVHFIKAPGSLGGARN